MKKEIEQNWNTMVQAYEQFTNKPNSYSLAIEWPAIQALLPQLRNKRILDLGCGTGRFSFLFEQFNPAKVTGVDLSENMLKLAQEIAIKNNSKVEFIKGDFEDLSFIPNNSYDFIFSSTSLHYLPSLNKVMAEIKRILAPKGVCILSVIHPVYTSHYPLANGNEFPKDEDWQVRYLNKSLRAYIQPWIEYNSNIENYLSTSYHHTFGDYVNNIVDAGLTIQAISEPLPPKEWKTENSGRYEGYVNTPTYLIVKLYR